MGVVALATEDHTVPGSATENFLKRLIAFLIGGVVALLVELAIFPVKARDRLVESLASAIRQISEMEACLAFGIETETNVNVHSSEVSSRFSHAKAKAEGALSAAETFLPFCANEPRLKGSFKGLALIYEEILYVLHAIIDRMDNMLALRQEYGSGVLEELNVQVYAYRRNVAGSITLLLFAVHEALTTKLPLPQFLPSARLAHLRMVNRVREVVLSSGGVHSNHESHRSEIEMTMVKRVIRHKFLSWNAASAGQIEVIEYLEELIDLVKLLVGANEFRSGLLTRPTYREYVERIKESDLEAPGSSSTNNTAINRDGSIPPDTSEKDEMCDVMPEPAPLLTTPTPVEPKKTGITRRRKKSFSNRKREENEGRKRKEEEENERQKEREKEKEEELPRSLQRVRTRRVEEMNLQKTRSEDVKGKGKGK